MSTGRAMANAADDVDIRGQLVAAQQRLAALEVENRLLRRSSHPAAPPPGDSSLVLLRVLDLLAMAMSKPQLPRSPQARSPPARASPPRSPPQRRSPRRETLATSSPPFVPTALVKGGLPPRMGGSDSAGGGGSPRRPPPPFGSQSDTGRTSTAAAASSLRTAPRAEDRASASARRLPSQPRQGGVAMSATTTAGSARAKPAARPRGRAVQGPVTAPSTKQEAARPHSAASGRTSPLHVRPLMLPAAAPASGPASGDSAFGFEGLSPQRQHNAGAGVVIRSSGSYGSDGDTPVVPASTESAPHTMSQTLLDLLAPPRDDGLTRPRSPPWYPRGDPIISTEGAASTAPLSSATRSRGRGVPGVHDEELPVSLLLPDAGSILSNAKLRVRAYVGGDDAAAAAAAVGGPAAASFSSLLSRPGELLAPPGDARLGGAGVAASGHLARSVRGAVADAPLIVGGSSGSRGSLRPADGMWRLHQPHEGDSDTGERGAAPSDVTMSRSVGGAAGAERPAAAGTDRSGAALSRSQQLAALLADIHGLAGWEAQQGEAGGHADDGLGDHYEGDFGGQAARGADTAASPFASWRRPGVAGSALLG